MGRAKIEKLLQLASRPGTPAEGAAALRVAERLAEEHGLRIVRRGEHYELVLPAPPRTPASVRPVRRGAVTDVYVECLRCTRRIRVRRGAPTPLYCDNDCRARAAQAARGPHGLRVR